VERKKRQAILCIGQKRNMTNNTLPSWYKSDKIVNGKLFYASASRKEGLCTRTTTFN